LVHSVAVVHSAESGCKPLEQEIWFSQQERDQWRAWGFDPTLLDTDPHSIRFAIDSWLAETIAMFACAKDALKDNDITIQNRDGIAYIKRNGEWVPLSEIAELPYTKTNDRDFWENYWVCYIYGRNFVHPQGFVKRDPFKYTDLYPIAKLTQETYERVLAAAQKFPGFEGEKTCVLRIVTVEETVGKWKWLPAYLHNGVPQHGYVQLIDDENNFYSFGTFAQPEEAFFGRGLRWLAYSQYVRLRTPDYTQSRFGAYTKRITHIPITPATCQPIKQRVNQLNAGKGIRFNGMKQNCLAFCQEMIRMTGVEVEFRRPGAEILTSLLPWPLSRIRLPNVVKRLTYLPLNALVLTLLRGRHGTPYAVDKAASEEPQQQYPAEFSHLMSWGDLFNPHALDNIVPSTVTAWQLQQPSTWVFHSHNAALCLAPPPPTAQEKEKWTRWGFDPSLLQSDPACCVAFDSWLGETIAMFAKAGPALESNDITIENRGGRAYIKRNGAWVPLSEFALLPYDQKVYSDFWTMRFSNRNFVHPYGIIEQDAFTYQQLYPIAKLTRDTYRRILDAAQLFQFIENPPEGEKTCVLRIVTVQEFRMPKFFANRFPQHTYAQLINENRDFYSFGIRAQAKEDIIGRRGGRYFFYSETTQIRTPDYTDPRVDYPRRRVTHIPITEYTCQAIIQRVNQLNACGIRYNFARQNCIGLCLDILRIAGVNLNVQTSGGGVLASFLARPLSRLRVPRFLRSLAYAIPNAVMLALHGSDGTQCDTQQTACELPSDQPYPQQFSHLMTWRDLFNPNTIDTVSAAADLLAWQLRQPSTWVFDIPGSTLCLEPPQ